MRSRTTPTALRFAAVIATVALWALAAASSAGAEGGTLKAWGDNFSGQFGNGTDGEEGVPNATAVLGISTATEVTGSEYHSLALLADGTVQSWGYNSYGELGDGTSLQRSLPGPVPGLNGVIAIAAGFEHSLALRADGTVLAWGVNRDGELGLGDGATGPETCGKTAVPCSLKPVQVPGLSGVIAISAAQRHSLALLADGTVMGWGTDHAGESSGDGVGVQTGCECVDHPVRVKGVPAAMAIGVGTAEGRALLADGRVFAWGYAGRGGLGNGLTEGHGECACLPPVPTLVSGATAISQGGHQGLALHADGSVVSWGANDAGQLGNGTTVQSGCYCVASPAAIPSLSGVHAFTTSQYASLVLRGDGTVAAFGLGKIGEVGNGSTMDATTPTTVLNVAGASGVGGVGGTFYALIGPSQALNVELAGAGSGTVGGSGLLCPPQCGQRFSQGRVVELRAEPAPGSGFAGFGGACSGTGICRVRLDGDSSVAATFGPPKGTAITSAKIDPKHRRAAFSFTAPGAITGYQCRLFRPKPKAKKHHHRKAGAARKGAGGKKRKPPQFVGCAPGQAYKHLRPGGYRFEVRALDILGADAQPAVRKFRLKKPHRPRLHR